MEYETASEISTEEHSPASRPLIESDGSVTPEDESETDPLEKRSSPVKGSEPVHTVILEA